MPAVRVDISIPAERYVALYSGAARNVFAVSREGLKVQFPGKALHRFVTHDGVHGTFELRFDSDNKLVTVNKCINC